jgi:hypothetical protein
MQTGGAGRDRTGDLLNANQALSQLSYSPWLALGLLALSHWPLQRANEPIANSQSPFCYRGRLDAAARRLAEAAK